MVETLANRLNRVIGEKHLFKTEFGQIFYGIHHIKSRNFIGNSEGNVVLININSAHK
jgi:hypothetical protein